MVGDEDDEALPGRPVRSGIVAAGWAATSAVNGGSSGVFRAMTPASTHTPDDASASISEPLAGVFGTGGGEGCGPLGGPPHERAQRAMGAVAWLGEGIAGVRLLLDEGGVCNSVPLPPPAGGHVVAALLQRADPTGPCRSSQTIRRFHLRPNRSRAAISGRPVLDPRTARPGRGAAIRRCVPSCCFDIRHAIVRTGDSISEALGRGFVRRLLPGCATDLASKGGGAGTATAADLRDVVVARR
jgi:hypothetical protein